MPDKEWGEITQSIPKLQRLHRWSLGMDKQFHPMLYHGCNYLSMLGLKWNLVSKGAPSVGETWRPSDAYMRQ